jgi:hypothetical protein
MTRVNEISSRKAPRATRFEASEGIAMKSLIRCFWMLGVAASLAVGSATVAPAAAHAEPKATAAAQKKAVQQSFESPETAADALVAAAKAHDVNAMLAILGPGSKPLIDSGDSVADQEGFDHFVVRYEAAHALAPDGDTRAILETGDDKFPFLIPLVKDAAGWRFDTSAGQEELIDRRIGRNELSAIQASLAYGDAQREYYRRNPEGAPLLHYARRFLSSPDKRDGLYWPAVDGEPESPLGPRFVEARAEGYKKGQAGTPYPFHGYVFRILDGQGPHAPGGAYSYVARNQMIGGFALIASPATYDVTGVMTFLVNQEGVVYQKDLGPNTAATVAAITRFDPDESWQPVSDQDQASRTNEDGGQN